MSNVNKVILIGRVGNFPKVKDTNNGGKICNISIATGEKWKDKTTGEMMEKTEWHSIVMFDRLAEITEQYVGKGDLIYIEGSLQTNKWQDSEGNDRYTTNIKPFKMQMLGGAGKSKPKPTPKLEPKPEQQEAFDDDIPF